MKILSERPNLQFLLREAKTIKSAHRNGDSSICATIGHFDTSLHGLSEQAIFDTRFSILDAQRVVARQYGFSSWPRLKKYVERCSIGENPADVTLRNTVLARHEKLCTFQKELKSLRKLRPLQKDLQKQYELKSLERRQLALDSRSFLSNAFDCHGWPGPDIVGPDCSYALMCVTVNTVYDADFQHRSTLLMDGALQSGGIHASWYAQLKDRYLWLTSKPTIYGSSFGQYYDANDNFRLHETDVVDPENLDRRRATVGFKAMEETRQWYAKSAKEEGWEIGTLDQCIKEREKTSIEGGYQLQ